MKITKEELTYMVESLELLYSKELERKVKEGKSEVRIDIELYPLVNLISKIVYEIENSFR
jgi:hypothetical protein